MADRPLDTDFVRPFFPALNDSWAFMENAGGAMVPHTVIDQVTRYMTECQVQPASGYRASAEATQRIEDGQRSVAAIINADPDEVVVGPSTTRNVITLAAAIRGWFAEGDEIVVTNLDHEANNGHWRRLAEFGVTVVEWQVDPATAELEIDALRPLLSERTRLVCFPHCSNVTGAINPVAEISRVVHEAGALVCVDGVAYAAHGAIDVKALDVDFYLLSLYKLFGPHLGVMYGKREHLERAKGQYFYFHGEDDIPLKLNPGAPNFELTAGSAGIGEYFEALAAHHVEEPANDLTGRVRQVYEVVHAHEQALTRRFLDGIAGNPRIRLIGRTDPDDPRGRAPTFSFTIEGMRSQDVPPLLDARGIAANAGDFYAPRILEALGIDPEDGVVRVSLVHYNTAAEVDRVLAALAAITDA